VRRWRRWRQAVRTLDELSAVELRVDVDGQPMVRGDLVTVGLCVRWGQDPETVLFDQRVPWEPDPYQGPKCSHWRGVLTRKGPGG